jgi:hypothetical protein
MNSPAQETLPAQRKKMAAHYLLLALTSLAALILLTFLNHPYRPFPTDEIWNYAALLQDEIWLTCNRDVVLNSPLHGYALLAVSQVAKLLQMHWFQTFLLTVTISLSGTALLLGLTVHAVTGRLGFAIGSLVLFIVSSWSQTYLHFYTNAPVAAFFMTFSCYCFTCYFLAESGRSWLVASAGLFAGLFFLSSSSSKLLAVILVGAYLLMILSSSIRKKGADCFRLLAAALLPVVALMPVYLKPLLSQLRTNISAGNGIDCLNKYGFLPKTPFFSFFHILGVHSPFLLLFLVFSMIMAVWQWRSILGLGRHGLLLLTLLGAVLLHAVVLDLLPFTKLGRTNFPLMPLAIIAIALLYAEFPAGRKLGHRIFGLFLFFAIPLEIYSAALTWQVRREAPAALERLPAGTDVVVLNEDPHHEFLATWLNYDSKQPVNLADLTQMVRRHTAPVALVIGPTGPNSGKSILQHSIMDDFYFALPRDLGTMPAEVIKLPYYAYYPPFMMEEENSQCFYFMHQVPSSTAPQSQLTVYFWPAESK